MSVHSEILAADPDSYWLMNESSGNISDSTGAITGTPVNSPVYSQPSVVPDDPSGSSILFDNVDGDRFVFGDVYNFTGSAQFTALCWIRPLTYNSSTGATLWSNAGVGVNGWALDMINPAVTFRGMRADAAGQDVVSFQVSEAAYESGDPMMVAFRYNGTNLIININGVDEATAASARSVTNNTDGMAFGSFNTGGSGYDGYADALAIFPTALSEATLLQIYQGGGGGGEEGGGGSLARGIATSRGISW